jgi:hypothetical protein
MAHVSHVTVQAEWPRLMPMATAFVTVMSWLAVKMRLRAITMHRPQMMTALAFLLMATVRFVMATAVWPSKTPTAMVHAMAMKSKDARTLRHATFLLQQRMMTVHAITVHVPAKAAAAHRLLDTA